MKAMVLKTYGEDSKFESAEVDKPEAKAGQILVKIFASSVNTVDIMLRQLGKNMGPIAPDNPALLSMDFSGTVEAVGSDVKGFAVGDEVYGCAGGLCDLPGTLAEYIAADVKLCALKPKSLSMEEAASVPLCGITAYEGLTRAGVSKGQKVLVHGGSGGVGHLAVQIAKYLGADVYATAGGESQLKLIKELGATPINYKTEEVEQYKKEHAGDAGFDVIFDSVGGANLLKSFEAVALNGQIATTISTCELDLTQAHMKGLSIHVVFMLIPMIHNFKREEHGKILTKLAEIADAGALKPTIDSTYSLDDAGEAYARLGSKKVIGKVIVKN